MPKVVPIVLLFFLVGCGYGGCVSQGNVFNDIVTISVPANPEKNLEDGASPQYWHKLDFPFSGKEVKLHVEDYELGFCEAAEADEIRIEIPTTNSLSKCGNRELTVQPTLPLATGELVRFSLKPVRNFATTAEMCRNQDEDVFVADVDKCLRDGIGTIHIVDYSNKLAKSRGFSNTWYWLQSGEKETSLIEDYVAPYVIYPGSGTEIQTKIEKAGVDLTKIDISNLHDSASTKSQTLVADGEVCLSRYQIEQKAEEELGKNGGSQEKNGNSQTGKKEEKLAEIKAKVQAEREKYKRTLSESSINIACGKMCGSGKPPEENTKKSSHTEECVGFHVVSTGEVGKGVLRVPFVTLSNEQFEEHNAGNIMEVKEEDYKEIKGLKGNEDNDISKLLPNVSEYLQLNKLYKVKQTISGKTVQQGASQNGVQGSAGYVGGIKIVIKNNPVECSEEEKKKKKGDDGSKNLAGSYSLSMTKDCNAHIPESLYYVFSTGYPTSKPGDDSTHKKWEFRVSNDMTLKKEDTGRGELYFGVRDNGDGYFNNTGFFEVKASAPRTPPKVFSYIVEWTEDKVRSALYGRNDTDSVVRNLYRHISQHGTFNKMVNAMLILFIMVSALYFFLGFSKASIFQLVIMIAKVVIVIYVLRPDSWTFFNDHLLNLFIEGPKMLIGAMTGGIGSPGDYGFMDAVLYRFSVTETWIQILSLMFSGPGGLISVILIFWALVVLVQCLFEAIIIYLISIMAIALLLSIAPYFLICILFRRTKNIFDMWIKTLLQTGMQPVIIFCCIALLTSAINNVIYMVLNFEACTTCVININLLVISICLLKFPVPIGVNPEAALSESIREVYNTGLVTILGFPGSFFNVLILIVLVRAARDFVINSGEMCSIMFGSFTNLSEVGSTAMQSLLSTVGLDSSTGHMFQSHKRQSELFDRGPGGGRGSSSGPSLFGGRPSSGDGGGSVRRRQIVHPQDPPASF